MRLVMITFAVIALAIGTYLSVAVYVEFFSDGPPYFGRRENMDKWEDPRPWLFALDGAIALLLSWVGWRLCRR